jgi:hypothetical protein
MKAHFIFSCAVLFMLFLNACSGNEVQELEADPEPDSDLEIETVVEPPIDCPSASIADFNQFLGMEYGGEELLLESKMGKFTGGDYTPDSSSFIYYYNRVDRVPISVWVNTKTSKINTVFMEVISLDNNFDADLEKAVEEFSIHPCESRWFGLTTDEIKARLGEPAEEAVSSEGFTLLSYDSEDFLIAVAFKIYDEQSGKCSSVSVNWFYN